MALKDWKKERDSVQGIIFRNKHNPDLTFEIYLFDREFIEETSYKYYCFPALNGKGIPNSPTITATKKEALDKAKDYMRKH